MESVRYSPARALNRVMKRFGGYTDTLSYADAETSDKMDWCWHFWDLVLLGNSLNWGSGLHTKELLEFAKNRGLTANQKSLEDYLSAEQYLRHIKVGPYGINLTEKGIDSVKVDLYQVWKTKL